jgi:hypothetical protein
MSEDLPPMHYIPWGVPRKLPSRDAARGWVLVHNQVWHEPNTPVAERGFRAWTQPPQDRLIECDCGWAPLVQTHYRIRLEENDELPERDDR